ncbi:MAG: hypothetical protein ABUK13_10215, partial [Gammaproteobacteria bacterium]
VQATDDRAVTSVIAKYYLDSESTPSITKTLVNSTDFAAAENVQAIFTLDLARLPLSGDHTIRMDVAAVDDRGQRSDLNTPIYSTSIAVKADINAPVVAITSPIQGGNLYHGEEVVFSWKAFDESGVKSVLIQSTEVYRSNDSSQAELNVSGNVTLTVPSSGDEFIVTVIAEDYFTNITNPTVWKYNLLSDTKPEIDIRNPAPGSRFVEGEMVTVNALVSDNRPSDTQGLGLVHVSIFSELDGVILFEKSFDASEIIKNTQNESYYSASLRVPNHPENGAVLKVGVRATDGTGLTTEKLLDIEILEDLQKPLIQMTAPDIDIEIMPGDSLSEIIGTGTDNEYINTITPVLVDDQGFETMLDWEVFVRNDKQQDVTVPNPLSFGELIVAQIFKTDFNGSFRIPESFSANSGKTYKLLLRAADNGINTEDSNSINLTILADKEAPVINLISPANQVYDRQPLSVHFGVEDNILLDTVKVMIVGEPADQPRLNLINLNNKEFQTSQLEGVDLQGLAIDLNTYIPIVGQGKYFTVIINATDTSGNTAEIKQLVNVLPDLSPTVSIVEWNPEDNKMDAGALAYQQVNIEDDYVSHDDPVEYFVAYSSLKATGGVGSRDPTGTIEQKVDAQSNPTGIFDPVMSWPY